MRSLYFGLIYCVLASLQGGLSPGKTRTSQTQTLHRVVHLIPPGKAGLRYVYVPFEVPKKAVRLSVSYKYDRANDSNTIDIGIFDARFLHSDNGPAGFRGWSGGRRSEFFISHNEATPGYLPGDIPAGTWNIILGLYRVAPAGVDVALKIEVETDENPSGRSQRSPQPKPAGGFGQRGALSLKPAKATARKKARWWRGDLHMHTIHSDGEWTVAELIASAKKVGLDFICITDHNTSSHHGEIARASNDSALLVMRGEEITTYGGHTNTWGLPLGKWIDFRARPGDNASISKIAAQVHRAGALISINHPFGACTGCSWSYDSKAQGFDCIEVWNGNWDPTDEQALLMWDRVLQSGRQITAIASTDSHRANTPIGQPATNVWASNLSQRSLLNAIRRGNVYLTNEAGRPIVSFEAKTRNRPRFQMGEPVLLRAGGKIRFFIAAEGIPPDATISLISNGQVLRHFLGKVDSPVEIECHKDSYFRLEFRDKTKSMLALTNPIYVKVGSRR